MSKLEPITVSIKDAAAMTGLSAPSVKKLLDSGEITFIKIGSRRLVHYASLQGFLLKPKQEDFETWYKKVLDRGKK